MKYLEIFIAIIVLGVSLAFCDRAMAHVSEACLSIPHPSGPALSAGRSEDGRFYVQEYSLKGGQTPDFLRVFQLMPAAQGAPVFLAFPTTYLIDRDGDGLFEEMYIDYDLKMDCNTFNKMLWDEERGEYVPQKTT